MAISDPQNPHLMPRLDAKLCLAALQHFVFRRKKGCVEILSPSPICIGLGGFLGLAGVDQDFEAHTLVTGPFHSAAKGIVDVQREIEARSLDPALRELQALGEDVFHIAGLGCVVQHKYALVSAIAIFFAKHWLFMKLHPLMKMQGK